MAFLGLLLAFVVAVFLLWVSLRLQRSSVGKAYGRHGAAHFFAGDDDGAIANFTESILAEPTAAAYLGRGVAFFKKGNDDGAIADFTEAIRLNPSFLAYLHRGGAYFEKGDHEKAITDYTEAIRLDPKCAEAYYFRGLAYGRIASRMGGDHAIVEKGIADIAIADRLGPKDAEMRRHAKACLAAYTAQQANQRKE